VILAGRNVAGIAYVPFTSYFASSTSAHLQVSTKAPEERIFPLTALACAFPKTRPP
jgi:hypothetical protein